MTMTLRELTAGNIRRRRMALGLNQSECAERIGIQGKVLSRIERGDCGMSFDVACAIAAALGCELNDLVENGDWGSAPKFSHRNLPLVAQEAGQCPT